MIKHIFKMIWAQRRSNIWIFGELLIVLCALWFMVDKMWVDYRCYYAPIGYDITDTWRLKLSYLSSKAPGYQQEAKNIDQAETLSKLMERIRLEPEVDEVAVAFYSMPYSWGNSWMAFYPVDGDTVTCKNKSLHQLRVSPEYFDVFRIKDNKGRNVAKLVKENPHHNPLVITEEGEKFFFFGESGEGRELCSVNPIQKYPIAAVLSTFRSYDFDPPENCVFDVLKGKKFNETVYAFGAANAELVIRTKRHMNKAEMHAFLEKNAERFMVNNLLVQGVLQLSTQRINVLTGKLNKQKKDLSLAVFLMVNVFLGVVGTFWLRTEKRRGEIGLRMALGSDRITLGKLMLSEGLLFLVLTFPFFLVFSLIMMQTELLDVYRESLSLFRFVGTTGIVYLIMAFMICLGIYFPTNRAMKMHPAEALHYE